jgi:hypothetical protein
MGNEFCKKGEILPEVRHLHVGRRNIHLGRIIDLRICVSFNSSVFAQEIREELGVGQPILRHECEP